jgi:tectonic-1/3
MEPARKRRVRQRTQPFVVLALVAGARAQLYNCPAQSATPWTVTDALAYTWPAQQPQGCSCELNSQAGDPCPLFDCGCVCNLSAGKCDYNCCCDPECTAEQTTRFKALGACLPEGPGPSSVVKCYEKGQLVGVHPRAPLTSANTAQTALDNLLCVQYDNSAGKGQFYPDPGVLPAAAISQATVSGFTAYSSYVGGTAAVGDTEGDAHYDKGDRIPAAIDTAGGGGALQAAYGGYMPLPGPDDSGTCSDSQSVQFEQAVLARPCIRTAPVAATDCPVAFSAARLTEALRIGAAANAIPNTTPRVGDWSAITITTITYRDWATGVESDFTAAHNCDAFWFAGPGETPNTGTAACMLGTGVTIGATATTAAAACYNALIEACYTITHDGAGSIVSVTAAIVLSDIPPTVTVSSSDSSSSSSSVSAPQRYTVQFKSTAEWTTTTKEGNTVPRLRSGTPGYITGLPVLAGTKTGTVMSVPQQGLHILGGGLCSTATTTSVDFGYDALGCCSIELTRAQLKAACSSGGTGVFAADDITPIALAALPITDVYIGSYGNADPADISQWFAAEIGAVSGNAGWQESTGTCKSVTSALEWRFLWSDTGSKSNSQSRILSADVRYTTSDWIWRVNGESIASKQSFLVCSSASFVQYHAKSRQYTPPTPPIAFRVPWDVFWPLYF